MEAKTYNEDSPCDPLRTSPLLLGAAVAALIVSAVGIGAVTGVIPGLLSAPAVDALPAVSVSGIRPTAASCFSCGTISAIRAVELRSPSGAPAGEADTATTILSAAGGIFAGQEFQKTVRKRYAYRVTLKMDDGSYRTVSEGTPPRFAVGEKVRLVDGTLAANS